MKKPTIILAAVILCVALSTGAHAFTGGEDPAIPCDVVEKTADNIFVGKVLERTGTEIMVGPQVSAQYAVDVIYNAKGQVSGTITVAQMGVGIDTRTGAFSAWFGDHGYLQTGATYAFVTRYAQEYGVYELWAPNCDRNMLSTDAELTNDQLKNLARIYAEERMASPTPPADIWIAAATLLTISLTLLCIAYLNPRKKQPAK